MNSLNICHKSFGGLRNIITFFVVNIMKVWAMRAIPLKVKLFLTIVSLSTSSRILPSLRFILRIYLH